MTNQQIQNIGEAVKRQEPALNASYLCSICRHTHNTASKIGRAHRFHAASTTPTNAEGGVRS
jgi:hypothetical protein